MAIRPGTEYPSQTDADADYPHGKARNAGSYQDGTGTPLEKTWVNDLWGFLQALLGAADLTPSGAPDKVGASQYLEALLSLASLKFGVYAFNESSPVADGARFPLVEVAQHGGFSIGVGGTTVSGPSIGTYIAFMAGVFRSPSTSNPTTETLTAIVSGFDDPFVQATRHSTAATEYLNMTLLAPSSQSVALSPDGGSLSGVGTLFVLKLA